MFSGLTCNNNNNNNNDDDDDVRPPDSWFLLDDADPFAWTDDSTLCITKMRRVSILFQTTFWENAQ